MTIAYYDVIQVGASLNTNNLSYQVSKRSNMKKLSYLENKIQEIICRQIIQRETKIKVIGL